MPIPLHQRKTGWLLREVLGGKATNSITAGAARQILEQVKSALKTKNNRDTRRTRAYILYTASLRDKRISDISRLFEREVLLGRISRNEANNLLKAIMRKNQEAYTELAKMFPNKWELILVDLLRNGKRVSAQTTFEKHKLGFNMDYAFDAIESNKRIRVVSNQEKKAVTLQVSNLK